MNKEELEKMFDEEFNIPIIIEKDNRGEYEIDNQKRIKEFIFETIIPKILKSIIDIRDEDGEKEDWEDYREDFKLGAIEGIERIKQKAKELYNITI